MRIFGRAVLTIAVMALAPAAVQAADDNIGCGIGSQLFKGQSGLPAHALGATTNGSFGNQTFGLSTGTLGCDAGGEVTASARTRHFADANMDRLARDMAHGQGETLMTLAHLMGVPEAQHAAFFSFTQTNFGQIFGTETVTADQMVDALNALMAEDAKLAVFSQS